MSISSILRPLIHISFPNFITCQKIKFISISCFSERYESVMGMHFGDPFLEEVIKVIKSEPVLLSKAKHKMIWCTFHKRCFSSVSCWVDKSMYMKLKWNTLGWIVFQLKISKVCITITNLNYERSTRHFAGNFIGVKFFASRVSISRLLYPST